jgi:hypothetical protein
MIEKKMKSEPVQMKMEVKEEKSLMPQLHMTLLRKTLNPIYIG